MSRLALLAVANVHARALLFGLLLGSMVHALAAQPHGGAFALAMALVMVVSGSIAFVLHALATSPGARGRVRGWMVALGLGIVAGVQSLALAAG